MAKHNSIVVYNPKQQKVHELFEPHTKPLYNTLSTYPRATHITMLSRFTLIVLAAFALNSATAQQSHRQLVYFQSNSTELTSTSEKTLDNLYQQLPDASQIEFELLGMVDRSLPIDEYNALLRARAETLSTFWQSKGTPNNEIDFKEAEVNILMVGNIPKRDSLTNWNMAVTLHKIAIDEPEEEVIHGPVRIDEVFPAESQHLTFHPTRKMHLKGDQGTILTADEHAFMFADGTPCTAPIHVELQEFYNTGDMLLSNLVTTSHGQLIETGGMMHIKAFSEGKEVRLRPGKSMKINLPFKGQAEKPGMQLFMGKDNGDVVDWTATGRFSSGSVQLASELNNLDISEEVIVNNVNVNNWNDVNNVNVNNNRNFRGGRGRRGRALSEAGNVAQKTYEQNAEVDGYLLETSELGWINCDRFYEVEEKTNLRIAMDTANYPSVRLVFSDINSIMGGWYDGKNYTFNNIPVGYEATIIAYAMRDDKYYFTSEKVRIRKNGLERLTLASVSQAQLKARFKALN